MLAITGNTLDLLQESLDCLYPNDLVDSVTAYRREYRKPHATGVVCEVWYDVRFTLYNMADGDRYFYGSARVDIDDGVQWDRREQFPACG